MQDDDISGRPANWGAANVAYQLPRPLRRGLSGKIGGRRRSWAEGLYDAEGEYSLRGMRERNCVFIHIPKCAGFAVAEALFGNHAGGHTAVADYLGVFGARWFDQAFKFTFVRDPWSRTVSAFDFLRRGGFNERDATFAKEHLQDYAGINDFVERGLCKPEVRAWRHFEDQTYFLLDPRTGCLAVDYLGRFETIDDDFRAITARLNLKATLVERNVRSGRSEDDSLKLSAKSVDRIADLYRRDIAMLGYLNFSPVL